MPALSPLCFLGDQRSDADGNTGYWASFAQTYDK